MAEKEILPREINSFPVDVVEGEAKLGDGFSWPTHPTPEKQDIASEEKVAEVASYKQLSRDRQQNFIPTKNNSLDTLKGGNSLAPMNVDYADTLGYFVFKKSAVGILSNAHVMGDVKNKLISPDGGRSTVGIVKTSTVTTDVDCAYAPPRGRITSFKLKDGTSVTGSENDQVGTSIRYYGRTSGSVRQGVVLSINWSDYVCDEEEQDEKLFKNQIMISERVQPGDSGSLLLNKENNKAIGLNFVEINNNTYGLASNIEKVLDELRVEIAI